MCSVAVRRPICPFVVGSGGDFFCVGISAAIGAGKCLNTFRGMRCGFGYNTVIKVMRCGLAFVTDAEADMGVCFIELVDHPLAPLMLRKRGNILGVEISAIGTSVFLLSHSFVRRSLRYFTVIEFVICSFGLVTAAEMAVSLSIIVRRPIAEDMICGRNVLGSRMHTSLASICLNTICCARGLDGYNAIVPRVRQSFNCTTVVIHALALVVFVTVRRPVCPGVIHHRDFLGLCMIASAAGIGHNTGGIAGRRHSFNTVIPVVVFLLIAVADVAIHSVRIFVVNLPFAPFVAFEFFLNAAISLAVTDVRVYAVIYPFAPVMAKLLSRFGFGGTAIRAGVCGLGAFGAAGSAALNAAIPVVRLCFFRGTAF
jgi:hypothetical protein